MFINHEPLQKIILYSLFVILGSIAGGGHGGAWPLIITSVEQEFRAKFMDDPSSGAIGFLFILTAPAGFIAGLGFGWLFANRLLESKEGFRFLLYGEGLGFFVFTLLGIYASFYLYPSMIL